MFSRNFQASEEDEDAEGEVVGKKRRVQSGRSSGCHGLFFDSICIKKFSNSRVAAKEEDEEEEMAYILACLG